MSECTSCGMSAKQCRHVSEHYPYRECCSRCRHVESARVWISRPFPMKKKVLA